jgi:nitroreductase
MTTAGPRLRLPRLFDADAGEVPASARAVFETLGTARAIRELRDEPVSPAHVEALIWAGTRASSAENTQPWQFVAVTGVEQRRAIAQALSVFPELARQLPAPTDAAAQRTRAAALRLVDGLADVPLLLFVCGRNDYPAMAPQERYLWSAVFGAAQNIVVAARALGLSAVYTMLHVANPAEIRRILGVPPEYKIATMLAVGWPARPAGPVRRLPLEEVVHHDRW